MLLKPRASADRIVKIGTIKAWVAEHMSLPEDATVMVTELACTEPGCPPLETVVAALCGPGDRRQFKVHKALVDVSVEDIARGCAGSLGIHGGEDCHEEEGAHGHGENE